MFFKLVSREWNLQCRMSACGASLYFSDLLKVNAKLKIILGSYLFKHKCVHKCKVSCSQRRNSAKAWRPFKKVSVPPQGSHCPSLQQSYWYYQLAVSLSSLWLLCLGCIFQGPTFYSQNPFFVLYSLINFKLLPNKSSLLSLERSPFCAPEEPETFTGQLCVSNDLSSIFICAAPICRDPGSYHLPCLIMCPATVILWGKNCLFLFICAAHNWALIFQCYRQK